MVPTMSLCQPVGPGPRPQRLMQRVQDQDPTAIAALLADAGIDAAKLDDSEFPLDFSRFTGLQARSGRLQTRPGDRR